MTGPGLCLSPGSGSEAVSLVQHSLVTALWKSMGRQTDIMLKTNFEALKLVKFQSILEKMREMSAWVNIVQWYSGRSRRL